ncbi:MAG: hypothetical protein FJ405_05800 [Verrucomicrobia bacterium]|nr:hypothetical protein [Verrucomicrobiota bacterium]
MDGRLIIQSPASVGARTSLMGGPGGWVKTGQGRLEFTGTLPNAYGGAAQIQEGIVEASLSNGPAISGDLGVGEPSTNRPGPATAAFFTFAGGQIRNSSNLRVDRTGAVLIGPGRVGLPTANESFRGLAGQGYIRVAAGSILTLNPIGVSSFFGQVNGEGQLVKEGPGALNVHGPVSTLSGGARVQEGVFGVFGSFEHCAFTVAPNARLEGDGDVVRLTLGPGAEFGPLSGQRNKLGVPFNIYGSLTMSTGSVLKVDLFGNSPSQGNEIVILSEGARLHGAHLVPVLHYRPAEGEVIPVLRRGSAQYVGEFVGWPEGGVRVVDGVPLRISYHGGGTKDVTLTVGPLGLRSESVRVLGGNGNGKVEPNECNDLHLTVRNSGGSALPATKAYLRALTPGVVVTQPASTLGSLGVGSAGETVAPFRVSTDAGFECGGSVRLELQLVEEGGNTQTVPFTFDGGTDCGETGGPCAVCNVVAGTLDESSPGVANYVNQQSEPSSCAIAKSCPGLVSNPQFPLLPYGAHSFVNSSEAEACVTVVLKQTGECGPAGRALAAAAYLNTLDQVNPCDAFLGDMGAVVEGVYRPFAFKVPAGARFEVVVTSINGIPAGACARYTLEVHGISCPPPSLTIGPGPEPGTFMIQWGLGYSDFRLEQSNDLGVFVPHPSTPSVVNGKFTVVVPAEGARFFRLAK